jgi:hypothetical protein
MRFNDKVCIVNGGGSGARHANALRGKAEESSWLT